MADVDATTHINALEDGVSKVERISLEVLHRQVVSPAGTLAQNLGQEVVGGDTDQDVERLERKRELVAEIGEQVSFEERPGFPRDLHLVT